jgi:crotonobetainyl-CoA:carnitine CoA-transferase CaiB-like acyl-CoA transferase
VGVAVADLFTGMYATVGILAALRHPSAPARPAPGMAAGHPGRHAGQPGRNYRWRQVPGRMGNAHQNIVPYQVFEVAPSPTAAPTTSSWRWATTASSPSSAWPPAELAADPRFAKNRRC